MTESRGGLSGPPALDADTGRRASDSIQVDLDVDGRVMGVRIAALPDELRESGVLAAAFRDAVARTLAADLPPAPDVRDASGRVRAARVTRPERRPLRQLVEEALKRPSTGPRAVATALPGHERGVSDNDCVSVVLDVSGPGGDLTFDDGWLPQATSPKVAAAITQAFAAAYRERGAR